MGEILICILCAVALPCFGASKKRTCIINTPEVVQRMEQAMRKELAKKESPFTVSNGRIIESE